MNSQGVVDGEVVFLEAKRKQMRKNIVLVINHGHDTDIHVRKRNLLMPDKNAYCPAEHLPIYTC